jgi:hypothetical protein
LVRVFRQEYRWSVHTLTIFALVIGFAMGVLYKLWIDGPPEPVRPTPTMQQAHPLKPRKP